MAVGNETIAKLSELSLEEYDGNLDAVLKQGDKKTYENLMYSPVRITLNRQGDICEGRLYEIVASMSGEHTTFEHVRREMDNRLLQKLERIPSDWRLITVLFEGIYIGDPQDLLNHRLNNGEAISYPIKGFGEKIASIEFLSFV